MIGENRFEWGTTKKMFDNYRYRLDTKFLFIVDKNQHQFNSNSNINLIFLILIIILKENQVLCFHHQNMIYNVLQNIILLLIVIYSNIIAYSVIYSFIIIVMYSNIITYSVIYSYMSDTISLYIYIYITEKSPIVKEVALLAFR